MDENFISIIPYEIRNLQNLHILSMRSNPIDYFPDVLADLELLEILIIPRTGFAADRLKTLFFNVTSTSFRALKELNMEGYHLPTISTKLFECAVYVSFSP